MRRTLTILAVIVVLLGIAVAAYFLFFAGSGAGLTVDTSTGNPFGTPSGNASNPSNNGSTAGSGTPSTIAGVQVAPHLLKITSAPVARGFLVLDASSTIPVSLASTTATSSTPPKPLLSTSVRYINRESGNMYAYDLGVGTSERLTNHTAPGVEEAAWVGDGSRAFIRFLTNDTDKSEHIDTYALPADGSDGRLLPRDLSQVLTQATSTVFTLMPNSSGSVGSLAKADGSAPAPLFTSPLSAIRVSFAGTNLFAYTKPSANLNGYAFTIDRKSGSFTKVAGPLPALTALPSPSGKEALVSYLTNGSFTFALFDVATHVMTTLPIATFAEKCVWAKDGQSAYCAVPTALTAENLPDSWYQGTVAFSDRIWKIDLIARAATLVANLPQLASKDPIDAVSLSVDRDENTLVFMNKRDGSLWAYSF